MASRPQTMDINSPKRRKLNESGSGMQTSKSKGKGKEKIRVKPAAWVPNRVPIEIFNLIIEHLPRSTIQNLRLVSREFDANVSPQLFRYVVVPFRPEIYGITSEPSTAQSSIMLQDKGMRIFQGFGRHIKHFAMSFEVDISKLTNPPSKEEFDTILSFWGRYKWPFPNYHRYEQLEGLEQKADETRTMTKAFQFIQAPEELGLSMDGGLGWLAGPDINSKVVERGEKAVVFGPTRFGPDPNPKPKEITRAERPKLQHQQPLRTELSSRQRLIIQQMLQEVGYRHDLLQHSFNPTIANGGQASTTGSLSTQGRRRRATPTLTYPTFEDGLARVLSDHFPNDSFGVMADQNSHTGSSEGEGEDESTDQGDDNHATEPSLSLRREFLSVMNDIESRYDDDDDDYSTIEPPQKSNPYPLKPNELTVAQKEMLLELEWAQRAFIQTFTISVIDSPVTFTGVKKLTIARLPSTHLPNLVRDDFWDGLPNLSMLSLGVIPDWRELIKLPTSWVQDNRLLPSKAVNGVFQLLLKKISHREHIRSLHFEWICGGEYAPGLFCRNQHVVAAPVVSDPTDMVNRAKPAAEIEIVSLPYIQSLSLKNCWFSPHIFIRFIKELKQSGLEYLTLDSVSLSAFIRPGVRPTPGPNHHANLPGAVVLAVAQNGNGGPVQQQFWMNNGLNLVQPAPVPALAPAPLPVITNAQPAWLNIPRIGSWAHAIETLTPGNRLADFRYAGGFAEEPEPNDQNCFKKVILKSCGYLRLPLEFDQSVIVNTATNHRRESSESGVTKRINDYESMMMKSGDNYLGTIANAMSDEEVYSIENAWNMTFGWGPSTSEQILEAKHDGIMLAGQGRFSGFLVCTPPESENSEL